MNNILRIVTLAFIVFGLGCSNVKPEEQIRGPGPTYRDLMLRDYDEMFAMVRKHTKAAHKLVITSDSNPDWEHAAMRELIEAERIILSRPNSDNMVAKLTLEVRKQVGEFGSYHDILGAMTKEGIEAFDPNMRLPTVMKTTYLFLLENLMSELKPEIKDDPTQREFLERIRDANIKVPREVMGERKLQSMFSTDSPSEEANRILLAAGFKKKKK